MNHTASLFVATIIALSSVAAEPETHQFTALGDIAGGRFESTATKISPDGTQVMGTSSGAQGTWPFIWSAKTGMTESPPTVSTLENGSVPLYTADGISIGNIDTITDTDAGVTRVTAPTIEIPGHRQRVLTTEPATFKLTGNTAGHTHLAHAVSDTGQWILTVAEDSSTTGLVWTTSPIEIVRKIDSLDGYSDITDDGSTLGYKVANNRKVPVIMHGSGEEEILSQLPADWSSATPSAISNDTNTIVGRAVVASRRQAFLWTRTSGYQLLSHIVPAANDWELINAVDVSSDGSVIAGYGRNSDGHAEAWIVTRQLSQTNPLYTWLATHALTMSNLSGDSDIDGISDLLEFVFDTDPLRSDTLSWTEALATAFAEGTSVSIPVRAGASELVSIRIEKSANLEVWETVAAGLQHSDTSIQFQFTEPGAMSEFVRIAVELR